jgi:hypothetical protein
MRPATDLWDLELVFSQQKPLNPDEFVKESQRRKSYFGPGFSHRGQLEALHSAGILFPLYRFEKNIQPFLDEARKRKTSILSVLIQNLSDSASLHQYLHGSTEIGHLVVPQNEVYQAWRTYIQTLKHWRLEEERLPTSTFLYSPYQLLLLPQLCLLIPKLKARPLPNNAPLSDLQFVFEANEQTLLHVKDAATKNTELAILLTALETRYRPHIIGRLYNLRGHEIEPIRAYINAFDPIKMLNWIDWTVDQIRQSATNLLLIADNVDPLREWYKIVRLFKPDQWQKLHGDALLAIDYRIAAEILLRFYEDLVELNVAPPLEPLPRMAPETGHRRLGTSRDELDEVLMDFGLSPQPSVVLVLEGETEELLIPRVMNFLGIPQRSDFIKVFNSRSITRDFELLARYITTPYLGRTLDKGVLLSRPPTHFLVALDPEKSFLTEALREKERSKWIRGIWTQIQAEFRTEVMREQLSSLVSIASWNDQSFEFAHFTDQEICSDPTQLGHFRTQIT